MIKVTRTPLTIILPLREIFLAENNFQIRHNAVHERGWSDSYVITLGAEKIGYGSVKGHANIADRNTVFEFYLIPAQRELAVPAFLELLKASQATFIESQTNEPLLTALLNQFGTDIHADTILFGEGPATTLPSQGATFRRRQDTDIIFEHHAEPVGDLVLELNREIIATGGFLLHYNKPFADLYMEVREDQRRKGFGGFIIQETKKECYRAGRVPAARCSVENAASKATLLKGGLTEVARMLSATVKPRTFT